MACSSKEAKDSSFTPLESTEPEAGEGSWTTVGYRGAPNRTHPLYKKLSIISGQVNARTVAEVKAQLQEFGLCKRGIEQVLRKRLKNILRREALLKDPSPPSDLLPSLDTNPYHLDYLCLLDFEATCEGENPPDYIHEIIEFPVLLLNLKTLEIESEFREYCRPCLNPVLSQFCKRLTGIRQDQVNSAPYFSEVFRRFSAWLETRGLGTTHRFAVVTDW